MYCPHLLYRAAIRKKKKQDENIMSVINVNKKPII